MKHFWNSLQPLGLVFCLIFFGFGRGYSQDVSNPSYQGRTAIEWAALLADRSPAIRVTAASSLRRMGYGARPALSQLTQALQNSNYQVIEDVAWTLGFIGKEAAPAVPQLLSIVSQPKHPSRVAAVVAIGLIGSPQGGTVAVLITILQDEDPQLRSVAALALGALGPDADSVLPALRELTKDTDPDVRHSAVIALGRLGVRAKSALPELKVLENDPNVSVRRDARLARSRVEKDSGPPLPVVVAMHTTPSPTTTNPVNPATTENQTGDSNETRRNRISNPSPVSTTTSQAPVVPGPAVSESPLTRQVQITYREKPRYTELAAMHKIVGDVILSVQFKASGGIGEVKVLKGLGYGLDESSILTAQRLRFVPAERNGKPVDVVNKVQYTFVRID